MTHAHEHVRGFRYNPFEVAVFGDRNGARQKLADRLFESLAETRHVAQIMTDGTWVRGSEPGEKHREWSGSVGTMIANGQLLEADLVIYEASEWPESGTVVVDAGRTGISADDWIMILLEHLAARSDRIPVYGLVLAGGRSRRMQQDKAAMKLHAEPQLHRAFRLLEESCERAYVSARTEQTADSLFAGFPRIEDRITNIGPLGGILSAQMTHPDAAWLVLACDLPFVSADLLRQLKTLRNTTRLATAFRSSRDGLPEPLCAVYEPKSRARLFNALAAGVHCPRKILMSSRSWLLDLDDPGALDNLNTPEDVEAAMTRLSEAEELSA